MSYRGMNAVSGKRCEDVAHIRQSVRDILVTPVGSRVMRREYGSLLPELIDQPLHGATLQRAYAATVMALARWEPRIRVSSVEFSGGVEPGQLTVTMNAQRIDGARAGAPLVIELPLRGRE